jgi:hypothetical protein
MGSVNAQLECSGILKLASVVWLLNILTLQKINVFFAKINKFLILLVKNVQIVLKANHFLMVNNVHLAKEINITIQ